MTTSTIFWFFITTYYLPTTCLHSFYGYCSCREKQTDKRVKQQTKTKRLKTDEKGSKTNIKRRQNYFGNVEKLVRFWPCAWYENSCKIQGWCCSHTYWPYSCNLQRCDNNQHHPLSLSMTNTIHLRDDSIHLFSLVTDGDDDQRRHLGDRGDSVKYSVAYNFCVQRSFNISISFIR